MELSLKPGSGRRGGHPQDSRLDRGLQSVCEAAYVRGKERSEKEHLQSVHGQSGRWTASYPAGSELPLSHYKSYNN